MKKDFELNIKQRALDFVDKLSSIYFEERALSRLPDYMQPRTSWIGTGEDEISRNLEEAKRALQNEMEEYSGNFTLGEVSFEAVPLSECFCIVYGRLTAIPKDSRLSEEHLRLTLVLEQSEGELQLVHMHFSHADQAQEQGHYFVSQYARTENQTLRSAISTKEQQIENLTKNIPGGVHKCLNDQDMTLVSMSDGFVEMFGYTRAEIGTIFNNKFLNMIYPGDREKMVADIRRQLQDGSDLELEYRVMQKNGLPMWVLDKGRMLEDGDGTCCFYCLLVEITDRKQQEEELRLSLESHQIIMDQASDIIFEWNIEGDILTFSPNWRKRFGYDAIRENISNQIPLSNNIYKDDMPAFIKIMEDTVRGEPYSETEFRIMDIRQNYLWCRIRATTLYDADGRPIRAVGVIVDIEEEKRQKEKLMELIQHDAQTGLYNKATINTLVERHMQKTQQYDLQALLIIDVDHFKAVNDTYGHLCGDRVLAKVAEVLKRQSWTAAFAGRIGGDEFMVYLPAVTDEDAVREKAEQLLSEIQSIAPEEGAPPITCSIGAALSKGGDMDYYQFYECADQALYQRKKGGRAGISFYTDKELGICQMTERKTKERGNEKQQ